MELDQKSAPAGGCSTGKQSTPRAASAATQGGCGCGPSAKTPAPVATPETTGETPDKRAFVPGEDRRKSRIDRRTGLDRRQQTAEASGYGGPERRSGVERRVETGLERRRGPGRRRADDRREAEEGEMNTEQFEFIMAIETYKKVNKRLYPTWTEILEIVRQLGYRKIKPRDMKLENVPEPVISKVA
jgi:hypothetical protein